MPDDFDFDAGEVFRDDVSDSSNVDRSQYWDVPLEAYLAGQGEASPSRMGAPPESSPGEMPGAEAGAAAGDYAESAPQVAPLVCKNCKHRHEPPTSSWADVNMEDFKQVIARTKSSVVVGVSHKLVRPATEKPPRHNESDATKINTYVDLHVKEVKACPVCCGPKPRVDGTFLMRTIDGERVETPQPEENQVWAICDDGGWYQCKLRDLFKKDTAAYGRLVGRALNVTRKRKHEIDPQPPVYSGGTEKHSSVPGTHQKDASASDAAIAQLTQHLMDPQKHPCPPSARLLRWWWESHKAVLKEQYEKGNRLELFDTISGRFEMLGQTKAKTMEDFKWPKIRSMVVGNITELLDGRPECVPQGSVVELLASVIELLFNKANIPRLRQEWIDHYVEKWDPNDQEQYMDIVDVYFKFHGPKLAVGLPRRSFVLGYDMPSFSAPVFESEFKTLCCVRDPLFALGYVACRCIDSPVDGKAGHSRIYLYNVGDFPESMGDGREVAFHGREITQQDRDVAAQMSHEYRAQVDEMQRDDDTVSVVTTLAGLNVTEFRPARAAPMLQSLLTDVGAREDVKHEGRCWIEETFEDPDEAMSEASSNAPSRPSSHGSSPILGSTDAANPILASLAEMTGLDLTDMEGEEDESESGRKKLYLGNSAFQDGQDESKGKRKHEHKSVFGMEAEKDELGSKRKRLEMEALANEIHGGCLRLGADIMNAKFPRDKILVDGIAVPAAGLGNEANDAAEDEPAAAGAKTQYKDPDEAMSEASTRGNSTDAFNLMPASSSASGPDVSMLNSSVARGSLQSIEKEWGYFSRSVVSIVEVAFGDDMAHVPRPAPKRSQEPTPDLLLTPPSLPCDGTNWKLAGFVEFKASGP